MKILVLLLSICPTLTAFAQTPDGPVGPHPFIRVERIGDDKTRSFFPFSTTDHQYTIRHDGLAENDVVELRRRRTFRLTMGHGGRLERLYIAEFQGDLILAYEVTNGNSGWGYVARLNQKARIFRWVTPVPGANLGPGLVEDGFVYVTAQNFLGKVDLQSGNYVWQSEVKQKNAPAFFEFVLPEIRGARATFRENGQRGRVIEVDKLNGENMQLISDSARKP